MYYILDDLQNWQNQIKSVDRLQCLMQRLIVYYEKKYITKLLKKNRCKII